MQIIKYLKEEQAKGISTEEILAKLELDLGITSKVYPEDNMVLFDYSMIDSPKSHPMVIESRSLILTLDKFNLLSKKFLRFFNCGEVPEYYADFSLKDSVVMMKYDGSLVGLYHNPHTNRWEISTRGMAKAEGPHQMGGTFRDHIREAFGCSSEEDFQNKMNTYANEVWHGFKVFTLVAEYISPFNKIVTRYDTACLVLLAVTSKHDFGLDIQEETGLLVDYGFNVIPVQTFPIKETFDQLIKDANELTDLQEGFVVFDPTSGKRMKIKSATYLIAHSIRGNDPVPSRKNLLKLVLSGDADEFLVYFSEFKELVQTVQTEVEDFVHNMVAKYNELRHIESQKEFAMSLKQFPGYGIIFTARKLKQEPKHVFEEMDINSKLRLFLKD